MLIEQLPDERAVEALKALGPILIRHRRRLRALLDARHVSHQSSFEGEGGAP